MLCQVRVPPFLFRDVRRSTDQKLILRLFPKQTKHTSKDRYLTASYHPGKGNLNSVIQKISSCGIRNSGKFCFNVESRILVFGIQNISQGIWDHTKRRIQNPGSTHKESWIQYLESGIHGVESRIQYCVGFRCMRQVLHWVPLKRGTYVPCLNVKTVDFAFWGGGHLSI